MVKVSVVIPVYNVEDYLEECLDSIVNQTLDDIEIICINDGSKDKSLEILNSYAEKDNRFRVIDQENQGHAVATNRGMELAKGEYLYLMDSDDKIELNTLEETYEYAKLKSADFVIFQSLNYANDIDKTYESKIYSMDNVADFIGDGVVTADDLGDLIFSITVTPWSKLYNNEFIQRIGAKFPEGLIFDDNIFFWEVLFNAKRIAFLKKYFFTRRWYSASSTMSGDRRFLDSIKINNLMIDTFKKYNKFDEYKEVLYNRKVNLGYLRFDQIRDEFKEEYYNILKNEFLDFRESTDILDYLNERNQYIFNRCINSENEKIFHLSIKKYDLNLRQSNARIDIINLGDSTNIVELLDISDDTASFDYPKWFKGKRGSGLVINSQKCYLNLKISCINDGKLRIRLKGRDVRDENNKRVPVYIDFLNLTVNDENIFDDSHIVCHDEPYTYVRDVVNKEIIDIHVEWLPWDISKNNMVGQLTSENKRLKREINNILNSNSWKLTKPLRKLKKL